MKALINTLADTLAEQGYFLTTTELLTITSAIRTHLEFERQQLLAQRARVSYLQGRETIG